MGLYFLNCLGVTMEILAQKIINVLSQLKCYITIYRWFKINLGMAKSYRYSSENFLKPNLRLASQIKFISDLLNFFSRLKIDFAYFLFLNLIVVSTFIFWLFKT